MFSDGERYVVAEAKHLSPLATEAERVTSEAGGEDDIGRCSRAVLLTATGWQLGVCRPHGNQQPVRARTTKDKRDRMRTYGIEPL